MASIVKRIREVRLPGVPGTVNTLYTPYIVPNFTDREMLLVTRNARKVKILDNLQQRIADRLHWSFVAVTSKSKLPLACMRSQYQRRWNNAFAQALKHNGLDYHGQKLETAPGRHRQPVLSGTLEIRLFEAAHWNDPDQNMMFKHSDNIIKGIMQGHASQERYSTRLGSRGFKPHASKIPMYK